MREILRFTAPTTAATSGTFTLTDPNYFYAHHANRTGEDRMEMTRA